MSLKLDDLHKCLDALEEREASSLSWGDTDGFFSEEELQEVFEENLPDEDPELVFLECLDRRILHEVPHLSGQRVYRTRMGESVHLYRTLRQWFHNRPIEQSSTLVSDFRFIRRPRSYPKRELGAYNLLESWKEGLLNHDIEYQALQSLLTPLDKFGLAGFQARATERIIRYWRDHPTPVAKEATGTIVCAGTGSGKTLAFYLPALAMLAKDVCDDASNRVRILAIYPRKELLKDQFFETWNQCRKLDDLVKAQAGRKLRIGAFFGDTPYSASGVVDKLKEQPSSNGLEFDLIRCGRNGCRGRMIWRRTDLAIGKEKLTCSSCGFSVGGGEVGLARDTLSKCPPDILFTTTDMLNQHLGNNFQNHLFGVGQGVQKSPTLVLLDEVHTYGGNTGAQTGYLLRRWMQRVFSRPHFVGLSATLADAEFFFGSLVGTTPSNIELIEPKTEEMEEKGAEYLLALRGDPVSQAALLSTTIQSNMLMRRMLDVSGGEGSISEGTWGSKVFVFTDDLDVNNRLYHQLSDAEGWQTNWRGLTPKVEPSLAHLRRDDGNIDKIRLGQNWRVAQDIGHSLEREARVRVARTSSQDTGVDSDAEIVVATASLEVGFNDPDVGAVVQHKAPRDVAAYLQRKGRAGRPRSMRPWMLVILSEFGRDRVAFQRYEDLIDPEVKRQGLPFRNDHIQKMQAAMATLDWLSMKLGHGSIWSILNNPHNQYNSRLCGKILSIIENVLCDESVRDKLITYLFYALQLDDEVMQRILWTPPRSIMMEFLPTISRLIRSQWREKGEPWQALTRSGSPLPEFIPNALFSELNLPTLGIALQRGQDQDICWEHMSFYQGLKEFAPGRISKRYAISSDYVADWLVPSGFVPDKGRRTHCTIDVSEAFGPRLMEDGSVVDSEGQSLTIYKPNEIQTRQIEKTLGLTEKSNSRLNWGVSFSEPYHKPLQHDPPIGCWEQVLTNVTFYTHQQMCPLEVVRYSSGSTASLRFKDGASSFVDFTWVRADRPVAVGCRQWVDGVLFQFKLGKEEKQRVAGDGKICRSLRPQFFQYRIANLEYFATDPFTAGWVTECFLAAIAHGVDESNTDQTAKQRIQYILANLNSEDGIERMLSMPLTLFQQDQSISGEFEEQTLQQRLRNILTNPETLQEIFSCSDCLWKDLVELDDFSEWFDVVVANTLAAGIQQTLYTTLPDIDERSVLVDAVWENQETLSVWLSEVEPGGSGVITALNEVYFDDPLKVLNVFTMCLLPSQYEQIDYDLFELLKLMRSDDEIQRALDDVRHAIDYEARQSANQYLRQKLRESGFALTHSFMTVLYTRILRSGSTSQTDDEILDLLEKWEELEELSEMEWGLNLVAHYLASSVNDNDDDTATIFSRFCRFQGMLWPRGFAIRQSELNYYSPFMGDIGTSERLLGDALLADHTPIVTYDDSDWFIDVQNLLHSHGKVDLSVDRSDSHIISAVLTKLHLEPVDHHGLLLYPRIRGVRRNKGKVLCRVELAETFQ